MLKIKVKIKSAAITTILTFPKFFNPNTTHPAISSPITIVQPAVPISIIVLAAAAALAIITAVQPISCMTFNPANNNAPLFPKESSTVSMICATYTINEERKKQYNFTEPYYTDPVGLLVKKLDNIQSLKDLDGKTIAVPQGATTRKAVSEAAKKDGIDVKFAEFPTYTECKAALMSGRAAAYAMIRSFFPA